MATYHDELLVEAPVGHLLVERHDVLAHEHVARVDAESRRFQCRVNVELGHVSRRPRLRQLGTQLSTNLGRTACSNNYALIPVALYIHIYWRFHTVLLQQGQPSRKASRPRV